MSDYIYNPDTGELYHYGVKGMKWGVRRAVRGHGGPGVYVGNKRKIAGYKRDLKVLDDGGHLSVGLTKKRQAAYDARDRKALNKGIAKAEAKEREKAEMNAYKKERKKLIDEYGRLEDQYTYGKNANKAKNEKIDKRLTEIEDRMHEMSTSKIGKKVEHGERVVNKLQSAGSAYLASTVTAINGRPAATAALVALGTVKLADAAFEAGEYYRSRK